MNKNLNIEIDYGRHVKAILTEVGVASSTLEFTSATALWDTGASNSSITASLIKHAKLKPSGKFANVRHAMGTHRLPIYNIFIRFSEDSTIGPIPATEAVGFIKQWDIIIGMDIISEGNFSIKNTNKGKKTIFSFELIR